jgi:hypothetical protein
MFVANTVLFLTFGAIHLLKWWLFRRFTLDEVCKNSGEIASQVCPAISWLTLVAQVQLTCAESWDFSNRTSLDMQRGTSNPRTQQKSSEPSVSLRHSYSWDSPRCIDYYAIIGDLASGQIHPSLFWWSTIFPVGTVVTAL